MRMTTETATWIDQLREGAIVAARPAGVITAEGRDAERFLQSVLSQDLAGMAPGDSRTALLLTAKARVVAVIRVTSIAPERYLLDVDPSIAADVARTLVRFRFAAKVALVADASWHLVGIVGAQARAIVGATIDGDLVAIETADYGLSEGFEGFDILCPGVDGLVERLVQAGASEVPASTLEALRIHAGTPRQGAEADEQVMPAEAGLVDGHISFTKGCFPGQEPVARLHNRGHANRTLRGVLLRHEAVAGASVMQGEREVGRITSVAPAIANPGYAALAILRTAVEDGDEVTADGVAGVVVPLPMAL